VCASSRILIAYQNANYRINTPNLRIQTQLAFGMMCTLQHPRPVQNTTFIYAGCCRMLQCVAVCCNVLQYVAIAFPPPPTFDNMLIERKPPPRGSFLFTTLIKNPEGEESPRSTWYKFFEGGPLPWSGNIVNRKHPPGGGGSFDQCVYESCSQCFGGPGSTNCNTLQHAATHCNTLQHTARHCKTLQRTAIQYYALQHTATHCNALQHTATHCTTMHDTATHCNALQHTATHCHTLQHTAKYVQCNTLQWP